MDKLLTCSAVWEMTGEYRFAEDIETLKQIKRFDWYFFSLQIPPLYQVSRLLLVQEKQEP